MKYHKVPEETVKRLPVYLRGLANLSKLGFEKINSTKLGELVHIKPSQIRKDLSFFGDFGTPGVGYDIKKLLLRLREILNLNRVHKAVLVGYGNLGAALLKYPGFQTYGLQIGAIFDNAPEKIGKTVNSIEIEDVSKLTTLKGRDISLGIVAVPVSAAQEIVDELAGAGIKGILNFTPYHLSVPKKVKVIGIDIAMDLARLPYYLPAG